MSQGKENSRLARALDPRCLLVNRRIRLRGPKQQKARGGNETNVSFRERSRTNFYTSEADRTLGSRMRGRRALVVLLFLCFFFYISGMGREELLRRFCFNAFSYSFGCAHSQCAFVSPVDRLSSAPHNAFLSSPFLFHSP